ncbi:MAG: hypothetical protein AMXMBFR48_02010 [Ignavibacteriales bacterium]
MTAKLLLHKLHLWAAFSLIALAAISCSEPASPFVQTEITLEALDASCTEVWLSIKSSVDDEEDRSYYYTLSRGDSLLASFTNAPADTLITDSLLIPNNLYSYRLEVRNRQNSLIKEILLDVPTLAPSSSDFTWQSWSFGDDILYSSLYDVEIIDENNIWVVGQIYIPDTDSSGAPIYYNAAHWDGQKWNFKKLYGFVPGCSPVDYPIFRIIKIINGERILLSNGANLYWYRNEKLEVDCSLYLSIRGSFEDMIILENNNIYASGYDAGVFVNNGVQWKKIENSLINHAPILNLKDISYSEFNKTFYCSGLSNDYSYSALVQVKDDKAEVIWDANYMEQKPPYGSMRSITTVDKDLIIVSTAGIWRKKLFSKNMEKFVAKYPTWFVEDTEAIASNDFITTGHRFEISHFNGINLKQIYLGTTPSVAFAADFKKNILVAVGYESINLSTKAKVVIGKRN